MEQQVLFGDNIEEMRKFPDNHFDSIVTDSPYGLGKEPDVNTMLEAWLKTGYYEVKGSGFMGKKWDAFVPQPLFWKEALRVLKPGGYVLSFFGTRTYDWGVMAMRIAGFEIKDQLQWIYGSGFPKSMNISKQIDKQFGAEREITGVSSITGKRNNSSIDDKAGKENRTFSNKQETINYKTSNSSDEAKYWDGWGTALKPANEPIVLARKPLEKGLTITKNILKWGTGGLNIDACRIPFTSNKDKQSAVFGRGTNIMGGNFVGATHGTGETNIKPNDIGRWPANILFDQSAADHLDEQSGTLKSGNNNTRQKESFFIEHKLGNAGDEQTSYGDMGGASRFFYVAKPSPKEKNKGVGPLDDFDPGSISSKSTLPINRNNFNDHPTVKPVKIMRYLVRLITPIGGIVLDPFSGSGTTGIGCKLENFGFVGIDNDKKSVIIAKQRICNY